jgi:hypothetical protein
MLRSSHDGFSAMQVPQRKSSYEWPRTALNVKVLMAEDEQAHHCAHLRHLCTSTFLEVAFVTR